ncbi:hypothetical protein BJ878DRAFT_494066 [Calycina marina]|uniref:PH domain-containing protein n=1 Tax=Calycina marina TaxID=1763456 RepID=A0A9P7Z7Y2_9HELO|nr:hypothetical protein BJ878DRAFT_494066 [Calycina marina]
MAPSSLNKKAGLTRRKSLNPFSSLRSSTSTTSCNKSTTDGPQLLKKNSTRKRSSIFGLKNVSNSYLPEQDELQEELQDDKMFTITGRKNRNTKEEDDQVKRPSTGNSTRTSKLASTFGSLGGQSSNNASRPGSVQEMSPCTVLFDGEVQTTSGTFRKKKEWMVLTDKHLIRFKNQNQAADAFPDILSHSPNQGAFAKRRHISSTSTTSMQDYQSTHSRTSVESPNMILLEHIVTAYRVEDGRPYFTIEVMWLDESTSKAGSVQLILQKPDEADLWVSSLRGAAQKARLLMSEPFPEHVLKYLKIALKWNEDFDRTRFNIFRVAHRAAAAKNGPTPADDTHKLRASMSYLVFGINFIHMVRVPNFSSRSDVSVSSEEATLYGMASVVGMNIRDADERFELQFRSPLKRVETLELASSATFDIASYIFRALRYLMPLTPDLHVNFKGPSHCRAAANIAVESGEYIVEREAECLFFERTLNAYCFAYGSKPSRIHFSVNFEAADAPEFRLVPHPDGSAYTAEEILAVMRSLRYNTYFSALSFRNIDLNCLHGVRDPFGTEYVVWHNLDNNHINKYWNHKPDKMSLLYQEVQALTLLCRNVRKMDFSNCLPRCRVKDTYDAEGLLEVGKDLGSEIVSAILIVCRSRMTAVTWLSLNGIEIGEADLEHMHNALKDSRARFRALEVSRCGLTDSKIAKFLRMLEKQGKTLECLNISDNPGRLHLGTFQATLSRFPKLRIIDLSRLAKTTGDETLFVPEVMYNWRLEELHLGGVSLNEATLQSVLDYLTLDVSDCLRVLSLNRCNLDGNQVGIFMEAISRNPGEIRELRLDVSSNGLENGIDSIIEAIKENKTPSQLIMQMIEFAKERHFRRLLDVLCDNTTIRVLDISKASLPLDASPETCFALKELFVKNRTLQDLDISGEHAHLEDSRFGIGLNQALTGLVDNTTLQTLRIEHQRLGFEGASTLATVIRKNSSLRHIHCGQNGFTLQAFTGLVSALEQNYTVVMLPFTPEDEEKSMKRMKDSLNGSSQNANPVRRIGAVLGVASAEMTEQDVKMAEEMLEKQWKAVNEKLAASLERNRAGLGSETALGNDSIRPVSGISEGGIMQQAIDSTTPRAELGDPVDFFADQMADMSLNQQEDETPAAEAGLKRASAVSSKAGFEWDSAWG